MKSKTTTRIILILVVLVWAIYLLYPTYVLNNLTDEQKKSRELENPKEFMKLKSKGLNLGLDLQGGMHVVLEVNVRELLDKLARNKDDNFTAALAETETEVNISDEDFITIFNRQLNKRGVKITRYYSSAEYRTESEVLDYLRTQSEEAVSRSKEILTNRVDEFGVSEPIVQKQGDRRIIIELAGVTNPTRVRALIGRTAKLEFKLLKDNTVAGAVTSKINQFILSKISPEDTIGANKNNTNKDTTATSAEELFGINENQNTSDTAAVAQSDSLANLFEEGLFFLDPRDNQSIVVPANKENKFREVLKLEEIQRIINEEGGNGEFVWAAKPTPDGQYYRVYFVNKNVELSGSTITDAYAAPGNANDPSSIGRFEVPITLNDEGAHTFARVSGANIGKRLAIILDNKVFLAPTLQVKITNGRGRITGLESMNEAKDIAIVLKAGALPAPVKIIEERTVGPSLGHDSIVSGTYSAIYGLILVMLFMILYYKLSGIVADLALILNIVFIMAVMAYFHATLTLPGIEGIILTIGMAVDANVLVFERMREEMRRGKTTRATLDTGYGKALITILDANVTTFIAGLVLYTYGSGPIQGFALTLMIGILASMFTAIIVTRVIYDFMLEKNWMKKISI